MDKIFREMRAGLGLEDCRDRCLQSDDMDRKQSLSGTSRDSMVFESLLMMLSNPTESKEAPSCPMVVTVAMRHYLSASIRKQRCSIMDLCDKFQRNFKCNADGDLRVIVLYEQAFDHLNLLMIPNTVNILYIKRSGLKTISEWTDLKGKSLKSLQLHQNIGLKLNLDGLMGGLDHLPLENLIVSRDQLSAYFGLKRVSPNDPCFFRVQEWMKLSTLTYLRIYGSRRNDKIIFRDDSYGSQFHNVIQVERH